MPPERPEGVIEGSGRRGSPRDLPGTLNLLDTEEAEQLRGWLGKELEEMVRRGIITPGYVMTTSWDAGTSTLKASIKMTLVLPQPGAGEDNG